MNELFNQIISFLDEKGLQYRSLSHEVARTSEESARVRGEDLKTGEKALLLKVTDNDFRLFIISAAQKLNSKAIKQYLGVKKVRFATTDELWERTGLVPGSVPPFGKPVLPFKLYVDTLVTENEMIAFNAGSLTDSVVMLVSDYLKLADPEVFRFSL